MLVDAGADSSVADSMGSTPSHRASSKGHVQILKLLLNQQINVNSQNSEGNTPL